MTPATNTESDVSSKTGSGGFTKWLVTYLPLAPDIGGGVLAFPSNAEGFVPLFSAGDKGWDCRVRLLFDQTTGSSDFAFYIGQGSLLQLVSIGTITGTATGGKHATVSFWVPPEYQLYGFCKVENVQITAKLTVE